MAIWGLEGSQAFSSAASPKCLVLVLYLPVRNPLYGATSHFLSLSLSFSPSLSKLKKKVSAIKPCNMWYTLTFLFYPIPSHPLPSYPTLFHSISFQSISLLKTADLLNTQIDFVLSPSLGA